MKAYILTIEMQDITPLVWRRVIMPADATFKRLHDTIQTITNFHDSHLYRFDLPVEENLLITNDPEAYDEHQSYLKNKQLFEKHAEEVPEEFKKFEERRLELLRRTVRQPQTIKMDTYLEKYGELHYLYDYGDDWEFTIKLEEVVDDYYFGYPRLLDGAETAPPENVGGPPGYEHFKEVYTDEFHPDHEDIRDLVGEFGYRPYNQAQINDRLKTVHYKKTEWDKINHENYTVIEDKYVK
jgi:hypothetical protein